MRIPNVPNSRARFVRLLFKSTPRELNNILRDVFGIPDEIDPTARNIRNRKTTTFFLFLYRFYYIRQNN